MEYGYSFFRLGEYEEVIVQHVGVYYWLCLPFFGESEYVRDWRLPI